MSKTKSTSYRRYSDKKQDGNHSLEIQKSQILLLAERENLEIVEWRTDKATSAFHNNASKREGVQLILEDIKMEWKRSVSMKNPELPEASLTSIMMSTSLSRNSIRL